MKKFFIAVIFIFLQAVNCHKPLHAMYIPGMWEEIWDNDEKPSSIVLQELLKSVYNETRKFINAHPALTGSGIGIVCGFLQAIQLPNNNLYPDHYWEVVLSMLGFTITPAVLLYHSEQVTLKSFLRYYLVAFESTNLLALSLFTKNYPTQCNDLEQDLISRDELLRFFESRYGFYDDL